MAVRQFPRPTLTDPHFNYPDGPRPRPIIGASLEFNRAPLAFMQHLQRRYHDAATIYLAGKASIVIFFMPSAVRYILVENSKNFTSREFNDTFQGLTGNGLLNIDGEFHHQQRLLVQPSMHRRRLIGYANIISSLTEDFLSTWHAGDVLDISGEMQALTLRIVGKTLFGVDLNSSAYSLGEAFTDVFNYSSRLGFIWKRLLRVDLPFMPYRRYLRACNKIDVATNKIIAERRASKRDEGDVVSMLLAAQDEDGTTMTDNQVRDHVLTFFSAGHKTTAHTLGWTWYLLSQHPHIWHQLRHELKHVLGRRLPTMDDIPNLTYTDLVLRESMRLYPPAWAIGRRAIREFEIDGYRLPGGQVIMLSQWVTHRLPALWGPDALEFNPDRFALDHAGKILPFAYFPFGAGPHMCLGMPFAQMEARLILATIAQRFYPRLVPNYPVVSDPLIPPKARYGMRMLLDPVG